MTLTRTQKREIARRITNKILGRGYEPDSTRCLAREEARVQHWQIEIGGQLLRVMYDRKGRAVRTDAIVLQECATAASAF